MSLPLSLSLSLSRWLTFNRLRVQCVRYRRGGGVPSPHLGVLSATQQTMGVVEGRGERLAHWQIWPKVLAQSPLNLWLRVIPSWMLNSTSASRRESGRDKNSAAVAGAAAERRRLILTIATVVQRERER